MEPHGNRSEEHTSELQSRFDLVCRLLLEKKRGIGNDQPLLVAGDLSSDLDALSIVALYRTRAIRVLVMRVSPEFALRAIFFFLKDAEPPEFPPSSPPRPLPK